MFNFKRSRLFILLFTFLLGLGFVVVVTGGMAATATLAEPTPPPDSTGSRTSGFSLELPASPESCPPINTVYGQLDPATSPTQDGRIFRDGVPSTCAGKPYPGIFNIGTQYYYESFELYDNYGNQDACVVVSFDPNIPNGCGTGAHANAYLNSYDPNDQGMNYLGDVGSSLTQPFSFTVPADGRFLVVVQSTATLGATCDFAFTITDVPCQSSPIIDINPTTLSGTQLQDTIITHSLTISNPSLVDLNWYISLPPHLSENFADINNLPPQDWAMINMSNPLGITNWFQGNSGVFPAQSGAPSEYIAANFNNTTGGTGTISNWLLTPELPLNSYSRLSFWTRTPIGSIWPDRLEVRMSTNGSSTDVGPDSNSVGDFTELLATVNPNLTMGGYPENWLRYDINLGDTGNPSGRLAMRYFVTNAGPSGSNSNYIGIDTFNYSLDVPWVVIDPITGTTTGEMSSTVQVGFDSTGLSPGIFTTTLIIESNDPGKPVVTVPLTMTVEPAVDLVLSKDAFPDPVYSGHTLTYTLDVLNNGPSAASGVTLVDFLPIEVSYQSATPSQGTCGFVSGEVTCNLDVLSEGSSANVTIQVTTPLTSGTVLNQASVSANEGDLNSIDNSATISTTVIAEADLSLAKLDSPDPVIIDYELNYQLIVSNAGPSIATSITLTDTLPPGVGYLSATPSQGTCSHLAGTVTCDLGNLGDSESAIVTIQVLAPSTPGPITNQASVAANENDPNTGNNSAVQVTSVETGVLYLPLVLKE